MISSFSTCHFWFRIYEKIFKELRDCSHRRKLLQIFSGRSANIMLATSRGYWILKEDSLRGLNPPP